MVRLLLLKMEFIDVPPGRGEAFAGDFFGRRAIRICDPLSPTVVS
jgi:hypothetical protein